MTKRKIVKEKVCLVHNIMLSGGISESLTLENVDKARDQESGYRIQASSKENDHQAKRVKEGRASSSVARVS